MVIKGTCYYRWTSHLYIICAYSPRNYHVWKFSPYSINYWDNGPIIKFFFYYSSFSTILNYPIISLKTNLRSTCTSKKYSEIDKTKIHWTSRHCIRFALADSSSLEMTQIERSSLERTHLERGSLERTRVHLSDHFIIPTRNSEPLFLILLFFLHYHTQPAQHWNLLFPPQCSYHSYTNNTFNHSINPQNKSILKIQWKMHKTQINGISVNLYNNQH